MTDITPEPIFRVASGFMAAKHLFIANEIGLFDQLADGSASLDVSGWEGWRGWEGTGRDTYS